MAPKKKNTGKKANDDWEADLGESIAPPAADAAPAADDEPSAGGGGLMGLMRKNKEKRKKKGLSEDFVDGETAQGAEQTPAEPTPDLTAKAAEEANLDDEFALPDKKGKGKQQPQPASAKPNDDEASVVDDLEAPGRVLTKAEKEKLKKEREKQRKKEQVRAGSILYTLQPWDDADPL